MSVAMYLPQVFRIAPATSTPYSWLFSQNSFTAPEAHVEGDIEAFAQYSPLWRRTLEVLHETRHQRILSEPDPEIEDDFALVGKYITLNLDRWGWEGLLLNIKLFLPVPNLISRCRIYYEQAGEGDQDVSVPAYCRQRWTSVSCGKSFQTYISI